MKYRAVFTILMLGMTMAIGCKKQSRRPQRAVDTTAKLTSDQKYALESGPEELKKALANTKSGKDGRYDCATTMVHVKTLKGASHPKAKEFIRAARLGCGYTVPKASVIRQVKKIRAALKKDPSKKYMSECAYLKIDLATLKTYGHGKKPELQSFYALHKKVCE